MPEQVVTTESGPQQPIETVLEVREVKQITWIGLIANILLSGFKIAAGILGRSQAVLADGVHSLSDTSTDIALLVGVRYWSNPPDEKHPHGHRRIETLITALIGILLAVVAVFLTYNALATILDKHKHPPGIVALIAALISIASKEILYQWTKAVGKRVNSPAVVANAWHHRSDGLSSIPAAIAVGVAMFMPGLYYLDHVGALLVSVLILYAAFKIIWPTFTELSDSSAPPEMVEHIKKICMETDGVRDIHRCRTRKLGRYIQVDCHILVNAELTVHEGHEICEEVKRCLLSKMTLVTDVLTHLEPYENGERKSEENL
ncbi:MAG: cation diffusion facilitator family transporter [Planctomycetota bacterium]|jgi:cation diffusion facilitator family transporter